jgi:hypothetical protein
MKKILASFSLVLFIVSVAMAGLPTAPTLYNNNEWDVILSNNIYTTGNSQGTNASGTTGRDSLVGKDTIVLLNKYPIVPGYQYIAQVYDSSGVVDTVHYKFTGFSLDGKYAQADSALDSAVGIASAKQFQAINLPGTGVQYFGYMSLKMWKPTAAVTTKVWRFELVRRKPFVKGLF